MSKYRLLDVDDAPEDAALNRLTLELFVDESGRGYRGSARDTTNRFLPFGIRRCGALVDWTDEDNDTSDERLNILGKQIGVGELFTYSEGEREDTYRIIKAFDLVEAAQ